MNAIAKCQESNINPRHIAALESRGIRSELAVLSWGLWSERAGGGEALAIPFLRNGTIVNKKFRTSITPGDKGKIWQEKGGVQCFWNEDALRDTTLDGLPLIITEGEFDAMVAIQCGYLRTVSVPAGAPGEKIPVSAEGSKYDFLADAFDLVQRATEIILAVDNDEAGANLLHDLSVRIGRARCKFVTYPKSKADPLRRCKDLNEVLLDWGERGVIQTINRAQWLKVDGVFRMSELPPMPAAQAYDIGFPVLRNHYKVRLGDFCVVTGIPSMGKTSFVNDLCCRLAFTHNLTVAFASFEQSPQRDHKRNLRTWYNKKLVVSQYPEELASADAWIDRFFSFVYPPEDADVTLDWLMERVEASVVQHGAKIVVVDPWNEMDHARAQGESLTEYVGRAIKAFKRFAKRFQIHLIVVAHPSKQLKDQDGDYRVPTLYDISDSAHWYNKADVGIVVHRKGDVSYIRVSKSRYHDEIGTPGEVSATFLPESRRYDIHEEQTYV
ncbi:Archaeal primase DnaG/twinkle, TOPRIM domain [uncultured Caudovirales phage]|uniref:Archaeal primase DnaG/twinkle, TOPRIM domain n=1 Tax=uncultured Caudovirales phage TaxID=2100421 RepID=A0A6J5KP16_9CAUD|nr:Archaeal primase DnaG/twinkle, TOPRIM domain [uncultured Caudovirales phage]CAB4123591.1 Archaeal primase DnaG/twinkle, TOPRIM domain [uncultured Caudovirales phage]